MSIVETIIYAYRTEYDDVRELIMSKIIEIDEEIIEDICEEFKSLYNSDLITKHSMKSQIKEIYELFIDKFTINAIKYLVSNGYIYPTNNLDQETLLEYLRKLDDYDDRMDNPYYSKSDTLYYTIPEKYRTCSTFIKLIESNLYYFCGISSDFPEYTKLCSMLLELGYPIYNMIPEKYRSNTLLLLYSKICNSKLNIGRNAKYINSEIIINLFTNGCKMYNIDDILFRNLFNIDTFTKLFNINPARSLNYYRPHYHGIEFIQKYIDNGVLDVISEHTELIKLDYIKHLDNFYDIVVKYKLYTEIQDNYEILIEIDKRFIDLYITNSLNIEIYEGNQLLIKKTLDHNIEYISKIYKYLDFETTKELIDNNKFTPYCLGWYGSDLKLKVIEYLLKIDPTNYEKYYKIIKFNEILGHTFLTDDLVEQMLEKDISIYSYIPNKFKNRERTLKYLASSNVDMSAVPPDIMELIGGKSATKL
jgi:hypothetical protein